MNEELVKRSIENRDKLLNKLIKQGRNNDEKLSIYSLPLNANFLDFN